MHLDNGVVIVKPVDPVEIVSFFCDTCDHVLRTRDDEDAWRKFKCCYHCAKHWAYPNVTAWQSGWRPSQEQIAEAELDRMPLRATLQVD